jgi:hypothetical protein
MIMLFTHIDEVTYLQYHIFFVTYCMWISDFFGVYLCISNWPIILLSLIFVHI